MSLDFVTLDVFTTTPYQGNPLGVVHLPHDRPITQAQKQAIAREFNLSETVFLHDVDPANDPDPTTRRIDIFMTKGELPFAGHPTIGAAAYLRSRGVTTLVTKAGPIPITAGPEDGAALRPGSLHAVPAIRGAELAAPLFSIVNGMTFALIRLAGLEELAQVSPGRFPVAACDIMDEGWHETFIGRYYHVITGTSVGADGTRTVRLRTRMVEDEMEDPATGSAACALTSYLALHEYEEREVRFEVTQGVEMGRRSDIGVVVKVAVGTGGQRMVDGVQLGGSAVEIMRGAVLEPTTC
ncbi:Putative HC-toxin efflux carrier TOXA [Verticillium dahliae VDG2]|nr:Putative HC-toxin efflux carrier TOXA [Verticillium dahliae VDG2]